MDLFPIAKIKAHSLTGRITLPLLLYSSELICGVRSGMNRGATGQMSE